jgi:plasmid stability protein
MKTTLDLPDDLMRAVKIRAAEHNLKLKDVVADALRAALNVSAAAPARQDAGHAAAATRASAALNAVPAETAAETAANQRHLRFTALLSQLDQVPDLPQALEPLAWDDLGLPR